MTCKICGLSSEKEFHENFKECVHNLQSFARDQYQFGWKKGFDAGRTFKRIKKELRFARGGGMSTSKRGLRGKKTNIRRAINL